MQEEAEVSMALVTAPSPDSVAEFCRHHQISELALFGSALREDFGSESDIDLLATFEPSARISLFDMVDMADSLPVSLAAAST
jgi:uncharacterized protein